MSVQLKVFDILGSEVEILLNEEKAARNYEVRFDASQLYNGIYFYTLSTTNGVASFNQTREMVLIK